MPSFDLATGYVTFKGDFSKFEQDIIAAQKKVESLNSSFKSKQFEMAAHAAMQVNKQLEQASKNAKRMMDEIRYGKMGVMFRDAGVMLQKFQQRMQMMGAAGAGIGAAAIGAASVASPLAADTLQGSIKLLTATVGREFVPMVMQLSYALQDAAKWWRELDPAVRGATAETVKMVGAAGAAAVGVAGLVKILSMLGPVGIAAGVGVFAGEMMNKKVNDRQDKLAAGVHGLANNPDLVEAEKLAAKDGRTEFFKNRKDGIELARLDLLRAVNTRNEAVGKSNDYQKGLFGGGGFVAGAQRVWDGFGGDKGDSLLKDVEKASIDQVKAQARLNAVLKANGQDPAAPNRHLLDMVGGAAQAGLQGGKDGGHALGSMGPSSYSSLQDFYRTFNVNATSGSSLEAQTLQIQTQMRDEIVKMNQTLDQKLGKAN